MTRRRSPTSTRRRSRSALRADALSLGSEPPCRSSPALSSVLARAFAAASICTPASLWQRVVATEALHLPHALVPTRDPHLTRPAARRPRARGPPRTRSRRPAAPRARRDSAERPDRCRWTLPNTAPASSTGPPCPRCSRARPRTRARLPTRAMGRAPATRVAPGAARPRGARDVGPLVEQEIAARGSKPERRAPRLGSCVGSAALARR
jgi:hypothetical protein